uniref:Uncharacterized protein n=1 Tax=Sphaeramia orbicularis TaxID=375764 RepID=A0A672YY74_9TELE
QCTHSDCVPSSSLHQHRIEALQGLHQSAGYIFSGLCTKQYTCSLTLPSLPCSLFQWNLVCDSAWKVHIAKFSLLVGSIFGYLVMGVMADWYAASSVLLFLLCSQDGDLQKLEEPSDPYSTFWSLC